MTSRGKTTPSSTGGSFKPSTGARSRVDVPAASDDIAPVDKPSELDKKVCPKCDGGGAVSYGQCPACRGTGEVSSAKRARLEQQAADSEAATLAAPYSPMSAALGRVCGTGSLGWILNKPSLKRLKEFIVDAANANPDDDSWIGFPALKDGCDPRGGSVRHQVMRAACDTAFRFAQTVEYDPAASPRARELAEAITTIGPTRLYSGTRDTHKLVKADMTEHAAEWAASPHTELQELARVISPDTRGGPWADQVLSTVGRAVTALTYEISK